MTVSACNMRATLLTAMAAAPAYNPITMSSSTFPPLRAALIALACALPFALAHAQAASQPAAAEPAPAAAQDPTASPRANQRIEHIHVEDSGAKVDEVRYGGRTQSITVQPKAGVPSYEVMPNDNRTRPGDSGSNGTGARVWNVMKF